MTHESRGSLRWIGLACIAPLLVAAGALGTYVVMRRAKPAPPPIDATMVSRERRRSHSSPKRQRGQPHRHLWEIARRSRTWTSASQRTRRDAPESSWRRRVHPRPRVAYGCQAPFNRTRTGPSW